MTESAMPHPSSAPLQGGAERSTTAATGPEAG